MINITGRYGLPPGARFKQTSYNLVKQTDKAGAITLSYVNMQVIKGGAAQMRYSSSVRLFPPDPCRHAAAAFPVMFRGPLIQGSFISSPRAEKNDGRRRIDGVIAAVLFLGHPFYREDIPETA